MVKYNRRKTDRKRKRKPPWILGGLLILLLVFLVLLQSSNLWKSFTIDSASDTLLLYALSSLNFLAFIIFAFIFIRSLLKLRQERKALQLGSKIKTRLLGYFFAISLLPLVAMAVFSYLFMNRALDRWFSSIPETVVRRSGLNQTASILAKTLEGKKVTQNELQTILQAGSFSRVEIVSPEAANSESVEAGVAEARSIEFEKVLADVKKENWQALHLGDGRDFDAVVADMSDGRKLVIIADMGETLSPVAQNSLREFDRLKSSQGFVRRIGLTTLGLLTFLLIFASSWMALYVAKGLTRPIRALAEGAGEITKGNLGYQVRTLAEDELDILVNAFNEMSAKLEENSAELTERRRYIETILQSLSTGVISFDSDSRVTTINRAALQMFRLEDGDYAGFELSELVSDENRPVFEKLITRAKRIGRAFEQTTLQRERTEDSADLDYELPVALSASGLPHENGVVFVIEDLSELIAAQRASAWREVARRMAHEIKNPLTPIQLSAERIAKKFAGVNGDESEISETSSAVEELNGQTEDLVSSGERKKMIIKEGTDTILREVSSLKSMVNEFSKFARLPKADLKKSNLNDVINQACLLYADREAVVEIETKLDKTLPDAMIDGEQLKRVYVNLIDNAIEAFESDQAERKVLIKTYLDPARDLIVSEVSDNGKGIPPSDFQRLFQPYFSTKGRGTGLGLAIVNRIVTDHGGKIRGMANNHRGAKFVIELPL